MSDPDRLRHSPLLQRLRSTERDHAMAKRIIAVVGATGSQGGGLVRAILADEAQEFAVRALTRNPDSPKARKLEKLGAEVVAADVEDLASIRRAFEGAYGAFCVTFFWEHFSPAKEIEHATALASAAKECGIEHVVWSTLEDTRERVPLDDDRMPTLQERYKVPHFDAKGEADKVFTALGVPTTNLRTSFYWDNLIHFGMGPKRGPDGTLAITLPMDDKKLPGIAAEDIGRCALGIFKQGKSLIGKTVGIAGDHLTGDQMADSLSRALGKPVKYNSVPPEAYRSLGFPGADDLGNMFQYKHDFEREFCAQRSLDFSRQLNPSLQSFDQWLEANGARIPLE